MIKDQKEDINKKYDQIIKWINNEEIKEEEKMTFIVVGKQ